MNRSLAAWISARPWPAALVAAVCGLLLLQGVVLFAVEASAIPALILLERGTGLGRRVALASSAVVAGAILLIGQPWWLALVYVVLVYVLPLISVEILRRTGSLLLVFQLTLLAALVALLVVYAVLPEPAAVWQRVLSETFAALSQAGIQVEMDDNSVAEAARGMWGALIAMLAALNLCAVFLARWWHTLLHVQGVFGAEFRQLRLGKILGGVQLGIVVLALWLNVELIDAMAWVAMLGLAFQGLAAAHRMKAEGRLRHGWLVAVYVFLIVPLFTFVMVMMLAVWGLLDNWRRMRPLGS